MVYFFMRNVKVDYNGDINCLSERMTKDLDGLSRIACDSYYFEEILANGIKGFYNLIGRDNYTKDGINVNDMFLDRDLEKDGVVSIITTVNNITGPFVEIDLRKRKYVFQASCSEELMRDTKRIMSIFGLKIEDYKK